MERGAIIVIPARSGSTRLSKKVILSLKGKPMLWYVYKNAQRVKNVESVLIATDSQEILSVVQGFGGKAVLTSPLHKCGTDRIAEAVENIDCSIIINVQADEPLLSPLVVEELLQQMLEFKDCQMGTVAVPIDSMQDIQNPSITKVVCDRENFALYFSRSGIPYPKKLDSGRWLKHLGIYAYRKDFLRTFTRIKHSMLEDTEGLEQLRALENGYRIKVVISQYDSISVDTMEDLKKVREIMKDRQRDNR